MLQFIVAIVNQISVRHVKTHSIGFPHGRISILTVSHFLSSLSGCTWRTLGHFAVNDTFMVVMFYGIS